MGLPGPASSASPDSFPPASGGARGEGDCLSDADALFENAPTIQILINATGGLSRVNRAAREYFGLPNPPPAALKAGDLIGCLHDVSGKAGCGAGPQCETCPLRNAVVGALGQEPARRRRVEVRRSVRRGGVEQEAVLSVAVGGLRHGGGPCALISLEDVTALRVADDRMRELAVLPSACHDAVCLVDMDGQIRFWNKSAERIYGWTSEEVVGESVAKALFGGSKIAWNRLRHSVLEELVWDGELQQYRRDAHPLTVDVRANLVRDGQGGARSILIVAADVTEKRQLEKQVFRGQRLESLGTLACGIAHDLNNVLTPVQMVADLLRPAVAGTDGERFLELLTRSARRGGDIIKQLLMFGRGVEGSRAELDLRLLLKETATILRETFPKSIQMQVRVPPTLWPVIADATQIHQVVLNLCVNARDAMPHGGLLTVSASHVEITEEMVRDRADAKPGRYVMIQVEDTGTGIAPEIRDRIFDPFFTTKTPGHGTGLGLSSARGIVRGHNGFIRMRSELGQGSTFEVYLPAGVEAFADSATYIHPAPPPPGQGWILIADDEEAIRELVARTLERAGYKVISAGDGAEAISLFGRRQAEIDAVILDLMMPYIDGASAIQSMRRMRPSVPILAISGLPGLREEAERVAGGRIGYLPKPFQVKELLGELARCLGTLAPNNTAA